MAMTYTNVPDNSLKGGIDSHSSEGEVQEGLCADALNVDLDGEYISKRKGYEIHGGEFPIKVLTLASDGLGTYTVTIDSDATLTGLTPRRLVLYGRSNIADSNFVAQDTVYTVASTTVSVTGATTFTLADGNADVADTDTTPELYVYGFTREDVYTAARRLNVNHLDKYKTSSTNTLVAGIDGNLFSRTASGVTTFYTGIRSIVNGANVIGPRMWATGASPGISDVYLTADNIADNLCEVTAVAYNSSTGYVEYTLKVTNYAMSAGALSDIFVNDYPIFISNIMDSKFNGTFKMRSVSVVDANTLKVVVVNSSITNDDFDIDECSGKAGLFWDTINLTVGTVSNPFHIGDVLYGDDIGDTLLPDVVATGASTVIVDNVADVTTLSNTSLVWATRTSDMVIPYSDNTNTAFQDMASVSVFDNDIVTISNQDDDALQEKAEVVYWATATTVSATITGDGTTATITLGSAAPLLEDGYVNLWCCGPYSGVHLITGDNSGGGSTSTVITIASTCTTTISAGGVAMMRYLKLGRSCALQGLSSAAAENTVDKPYVWIPVFPHVYSEGIHESGEIEHTVAQKSVMAQDSLFVAGDHDYPVRKYDGSNVSAAGLPNIRTSLFCTLDETVSSKVAVNPIRVQISTAVATNVNIVTCAGAATDANKFKEGQTITFRRENTNDNVFTRETYTVTAVDGTAGTITFSPSVTIDITGTGNYYIIGDPVFYKYYARLSYIDTNDNIIAGPSLGSDELTVMLTRSAGVRIRGFVPALSQEEYDTDKLLVEIFRTKANSIYPYYKLTSLSLADYTWYWDYLDHNADAALYEGNLDPLLPAIIEPRSAFVSGGDIGKTRTYPVSAKAITTTGNRMCLANLKDDSTIQYDISPLSELVSGSDLDGNTVSVRAANTSLPSIYFHGYGNTAGSQFTSNSNVTTITATLDTSFRVNVSSGSVPDAGDIVYICFDAEDTSQDPTFCGWWQVASANPTNLTILWDKTPSTATAAMYTNIRVVWKDSPAATLDWVPFAVYPDYLNMFGSFTVPTSNALLTYTYGLTNAMNAYMAVVSDITPNTYTEPFLYAEGGLDYQLGYLRVNRLDKDTTTDEINVGTLTSYCNVYANFTKVEAGATDVLFTQKVYPNRLITSYSSFPEMFDNIRAAAPQDSYSAIDVDPNDGDEITAIIPFYGTASFGAAQKSGVLVVFKKMSIHLVDVDAKWAGATDYIKKIESRGLGCEAPHSVISTKYGILFANTSGVYMLQRDMNIYYIGSNIERLWQSELLNKEQVALCAATNFTTERRYKLSIPINSATSNTDVLVFHDKDDAEQSTDGWTRYDNHPALLWCMLDNDNYFASTEGLVYKCLGNGNELDYRDNDTAINSEFVTKANNFGVLIKKAIRYIGHVYRNATDQDQDDIELKYAVDLDKEYSDTTEYKVKGRNNSAANNVGDVVRKFEVGVSSAISQRRFNYLQLKFVHNVVNKGFSLVRIFYRLAGLRTRSYQEAKQSQDD